MLASLVAMSEESEPKYAPYEDDGFVKLVHDMTSWQILLSDVGDALLVVHFSAQWCYPCDRVRPQFTELAQGFHDTHDVWFCEVDVEELVDLAQEHGIDAMPTFAFFHRGQLRAKIEGADILEVTEYIQETLHPEG